MGELEKSHIEHNKEREMFRNMTIEEKINFIARKFDLI